MLDRACYPQQAVVALGLCRARLMIVCGHAAVLAAVYVIVCVAVCGYVAAVADAAVGGCGQSNAGAGVETGAQGPVLLWIQLWPGE